MKMSVKAEQVGLLPEKRKWCEMNKDAAHVCADPNHKRRKDHAASEMWGKWKRVKQI
jgi:hypothetical protein